MDVRWATQGWEREGYAAESRTPSAFGQERTIKGSEHFEKWDIFQML